MQTGMVLVVDCDGEARRALVRELVGDGLRCLEAEDAAAARRALARGLAACVVDVGTEGFDEVCAEVDRVGATLVCSGSDAATDWRRAMRAGAREFIVKPLDGGSGRRVQDCLAVHRARPTSLVREEDHRRLRANYEELKRHFAEQIRSFEESQETFYLDLTRMMTIIGNIMDGIVFADREANIVLLNPVAEDLLGVRTFIAIGKKVGDLAGRRDLLKALREDHEKVMTCHEVCRTIEVHHSEQDLLYIKAHTTKVLDYKGSFAGVLTVLQDVTSEYKSDQLKNQYLSIVAHELRTPLTGIKTFSTMMSKGVLGGLNDKQKWVVESIREQSLRLEHQIDKLINLGYLDSNDYGQDLERFDVAEFMLGAAAPFEQPAKDRGISLSVRVSAEGASVEADRADLKRAVQALIENAVKFTPDGGHVEVAVRREGAHVRFTVRDDGIGIDPRYHRRIFEKFFQVEDPLTRHHGGAGLGLFVARGILEAHGAKVQVQSELGAGAEFSFGLPVHGGEESAAAERASASMPTAAMAAAIAGVPEAAAVGMAVRETDGAAEVAEPRRKGAASERTRIAGERTPRGDHA